MNVQSDDVRNIWVEGPSHWGYNIFTELFTQNIKDKEGLQNKSGFLKYNYSLLGNSVQ